DFGKRKDHLSARIKESLFPPDNAFLEVPWKNQEIIRLHGAGLAFGDYRYVASWCETAKFVRIDLGDCTDFLLCDSAKLQHHISLWRGAVSDTSLAVSNKRLQEPPQVLAMAVDAVFKLPVGAGSMQSHPSFLFEQPVYDRWIGHHRAFLLC